MRTAEQLYARYPHEFPGYVKDGRSLAAYAVSDRGNAQLAALTVADAQRELAPILAASPVKISDDFKTALYVDYYRKGPDTFLFGKDRKTGYAGRIGGDALSGILAGKLVLTPNTFPQPVTGVRVVNNAAALNGALGNR